jgi:alpha-1,6-mannosyltransferase
VSYGLIWAGFVAYLGALAWAPRVGRRVIWTAIALFLVLFAALPPLLSHDVYSYVDYARLGALHGLDPYVHPPSSAPGDAAFAHVTWTEATSAYGPLFTLATYPLAWLSVGAAVYALKAAAAIAVFATAWLVARLAPGRGVDPLRAAAFVALNPLVLVHVVGGPHNDAFMVLLSTLGIACLLSSRNASAGAVLVVAVGTKAAAAITLPFALLATAKSRSMGLKAVHAPTSRPVGRLLLGGAGALVGVGIVGWLGFGESWLHAFGLAGENQGRTSYMSIPILVARLTGLDPGTTRIAFWTLFAALVVYLLAWTARGGDWLRATAWATAALLLATSWLLPWYLLWALPPAALSRDRSLQLLVLALTAYQLGARIPL